MKVFSNHPVLHAIQRNLITHIIVYSIITRTLQSCAMGREYLAARLYNSTTRDSEPAVISPPPRLMACVGQACVLYNDIFYNLLVSLFVFYLLEMSMNKVLQTVILEVIYNIYVMKKLRYKF